MKTNSLQKLSYIPLSVGSIRPQGWLKRQLEIQANGLSGHLDEFWNDIQNSQWIGGDSEGWERFPYWLDGVIPLAYLINSSVLQDKVKKYVGYIIEHQQDDGWLGPRYMKSSSDAEVIKTYDVWAQFLILKALIQYHDATNDERIPSVVEKNLRCVESHIERAPLFNWGQFRWFECLIAIFWLYERQPQQWLLDLATKIQAQGFDWGLLSKRWFLEQPTSKGKWSFMSHVVNQAMAVKAHGLVWRMDPSPEHIECVEKLLKNQDDYHGMVTGIFSGDECLAGKSPTMGTELCAVVEYAYSMEVLLSILGKPEFGDRLEKVIFNALPATFSPDMWAHQYDQQVNQIECSVRSDREWTTNGPESNIYGLEPNYGCCTANLSQGFPKYAAHLWMATEDGGIAAMSYAPCEISTLIQDKPVKIIVDTNYPFREEIRISLLVDAPMRFPLYFRIPAWVNHGYIEINSKESKKVEPNHFVKVEREWQGESSIKLVFPMQPSLETRYRGAVSIVRGPLVYSLRISEDWKRVNIGKPGRELPHADWEVYPSQAWNYGLIVHKDRLEKEIKFEECPPGEYPFSPQGAPVIAKVKGRKIPEWGMKNGSADEVPETPVMSNEPIEELTLIPYGCTNLRITEFPICKDLEE